MSNLTLYAVVGALPIAMLIVAIWLYARRPKPCDIACPMCESCDTWAYHDGDIVCYDCGHITNPLE